MKNFLTTRNLTTVVLSFVITLVVFFGVKSATASVSSQTGTTEVVCMSLDQTSRTVYKGTTSTISWSGSRGEVDIILVDRTIIIPTYRCELTKFK